MKTCCVILAFALYLALTSISSGQEKGFLKPGKSETDLQAVVNIVGYGTTGVGNLGIISASSVQQINLAGFAGGGGVNFQLTFNRPAIPGLPAAFLPAPPAGGFTTSMINSTVGAGNSAWLHLLPKH